MATLMELLRELPASVFDELRAMVERLGPQASPAEMIAEVGRLSPETREAVLALLVTHLYEELLPTDGAHATDPVEAGTNALDGRSDDEAPSA